MKLIAAVAEMEAERGRLRGSVGLVPTMGFLHEGHLSLVRRARAQCDHCIVSVFVNPTQFGPAEDYDRYPRDLERDLRLSKVEGVDIVFAPTVEEIYLPGFSDWVEVSGALTARLEGAARPGHFRGVTTVVARLFRIVRPHRAYFGQKDAQQLRVIRQMGRDLALPVEVVPLPTVRDADGLALSSRNVYLSPLERRAALVLPRVLALACKMVMREGVRDAALLRSSLGDCIQREPLVQLEYVSVADEASFEELEVIDRPALVLLAARVGATRLIDNTLVVPEGVELPAELRGLLEEGAPALGT